MDVDRKVKGLLGTKLGMTQLWDANNRVVPVTVVQAGPCVVTQVRTPSTDGYSAVQLGFGAVKPKQLTKPSAGHFDKAGVTPRKHLVEIRTNDASEYTLGQELTAEVFAANEVLDVTGVSKGKGTAGVMKRHGFGGLRASHGVHRKHRSPASCTATPTTSIRPASGRSRPPSRCKRVDFPDPDRPSTATISPRATSRSAPSRTRRAARPWPKVFTTPRAETTFMPSRYTHPARARADRTRGRGGATAASGATVLVMRRAAPTQHRIDRRVIERAAGLQPG